MQRNSPPGMAQFLGIIFVTAVGAVLLHTHQLVIPLFLGLFAWGKLGIKKLSPKVMLLLAKNSFVLQLRRFAMHVSAHLFVKSHRPWRRFLTRMRVALVETVRGIFQGYLGLPLWVRTGIAIAILLATAGSSFAVFALLIIPQPLLDWMGSRLRATLNRLGITRLLVAISRILIPESLRHRWYMFVKWKLGRQQVRAAQQVHGVVLAKAAAAAAEQAAGSAVAADPKRAPES